MNKMKLVKQEDLKKGIALIPTKDVIGRLGNLFNIISKNKYKFNAQELSELINMVDVARYEISQTFVLVVGATIEKVITTEEIKEDEGKAFIKAFKFMQGKYGNVLKLNEEDMPKGKEEIPVELKKETG